MKVRKTFVLIIGGGPTGVTTGLYLQKYKIPHLLIEKDRCIKKIPKAHYYNNQTMEAWRSIFHLDKCFLNETEDLNLWRNFQYCLNISKNKSLGYYDNFFNKYTYKSTYYEDISPSKVTHLSQYKLLGILYNYYINKIKCDKNKRNEFLRNIQLKLSTYRSLNDILKRYELDVESEYDYTCDKDKEKEKFYNFYSYDHSELLIGYEYVNFLNIRELIDIHNYNCKKYNKDIFKTINDTGNENYMENYDFNNNIYNSEKYINSPNYIITKIKNLNNNEEEIVLSNYVFVAEGGKSSIKKSLNINDENKKEYMKFVNIHFSSKYLSNLIKYNPSMLYFIFNEYIGVLVCHNYTEGEVVLHIPYITEKEKEIYCDKSNCLQIINKLIGFPLHDIKIYNIYKWKMHSSISSTFVDKKTKRIILLGDSAHKLPPSGGFGLNLGIGDVINITWKIIRIFNLKKKSFLENVEKIEEFKKFSTKTTDSISYVINEITKMNFIMNMMSTYEKKKIDNYINSYNIERKLVAKYTIYSAVKNYEKGNNIPSTLGYNNNFIIRLINNCNNCVVQNSFFFYFLFKNAKKILSTFNNIPYIFQYNQKKLENLFKNQENVLTLLYPGVDFCYSYIDTINEVEEEEIHSESSFDNKNNIKSEVYNEIEIKNSMENVQTEKEKNIENFHSNNKNEEISYNLLNKNNLNNIYFKTEKKKKYKDNTDNNSNNSTYENIQSNTEEKNKRQNNNFNYVSEDNFQNTKIFEKKKEKIPKLKVCKNIYEYEIPSINGTKIPHFNLYTFDQNYIYRLSTVDLPLFNNTYLSILVILFDNTILNSLIDYLSFHNISQDKFSFCIWDSDVLIYKNKKNKSISIIKNEDIKNIDETNFINKIVISDNFLLSKKKKDHLGDASKIKHIQINEKNYNVNYVFTSKLIKDMFLNVLNLKSKSSFVILRPDKHIISTGDHDLFEHIKLINKIYI
ncbi:FAD-dependent monooxygenase, putative [Plasmodium gallinaceum]|uniref:FAD-dependent monooxygenase, putative n=1 Tax=Plasmodium gallinaceum TaxID=5849 RepID=A0A1J1GZA2_PLAGA|nr:FAD-dependent monooxygenase, putative [Plasmodium gallinaceum]CRG97631.1 FAD-dependent monooxygenase, putative [Plasmodium gallinaceum]